jgi:hypothetical protein
MELRLPTDDLDALARAAQVARIAAAALRWLAACAVAFAGLLLLSLGLALFERGGEEEPAEFSASAYLDFDLSVLRGFAEGNLRGEAVGPAMWSRRPDWQLPKARRETAQLASLRDAWTAATSDKSRFRTAARGARDALPFLLCGLTLAFLAAAAAGMLAHGRRAGAGRLAQLAGACVLVAFPLWAMLDPAVFYDRTRSLGLGFSAALFVGAFAGSLSGAAARALFAWMPHARHLGALRGGPVFPAAGRLAAIDAADWLVPLVPALAAAALFVCAKADQDPALHGAASGLGALIRSALGETTAAERLSSCALVAGGLVVLWFLGHRFVLEVRGALGAGRGAP